MAPVKVREQAMATATAREPVQERGTGQAQETAPARVQEMGRAQETAMATVRAPVQARVHCSWVTEPVSRCRRRMRRASA
jgi:leucyl aminopeptidase (aminopeptidase T)